ncbi:MAG: hypothetical protein FWD15_05625 [Alphaproteobacteria bacterium]|nr:hypothetical protein [Alphaproteobacteria bacterium]
MAKKEKDLKEFVEKLDNLKKKNPKDLSSDQDLTFAIMHLISIEEHLTFSGAKTEKTAYYDLIPEIRGMRTELLKKIITSYEGEVWCTSKHLLGGCMRLIEVGHKQQDMGNAAEAADMFDKAYELYCLFWGLNMNAINAGDAGKVAKKYAAIEVSAANSDTAKKTADKVAVGAKAAAPSGFMAKLKATVKKAVDCCIE